MNYNWSDKHDYFNEIDEGYISTEEFLFYK